MLQTAIHYSLHFLAPGLLAWLFWRERWKNVWLIMLATMAVDVDHLFATPYFDPDRCSIGFHYLHSWPAIAVYALMFCYKPLRIVALGLLLHMFTDWQDCLWM